MEKTYSPEAIEKDCYANWESHRYFEPHGEKSPFCIMLPPPNITGNLHMGHGFQHTLIDTLIRYKRMMGHKTLWQPGTDHAGISTQLVVERQLDKLGQSRKEMSRNEFLDVMWKWKQENGANITKQMRRIGSSPDWSRERFTMDEGLSKAVQKVFIQLFDEGLIYRGTRLVNWDPNLGTAISDLEVLSEEENGNLWHIRYPIADSNKSIVIATTRPETMLGDVAIAVHPDDERYKDLIGKEVNLPLTDRKIPIIADDFVEKDFGSGCVKITPAHDFTDHEIGKKHNLPYINIFTKKAAINKNCPVKYQGMDRFVARDSILKDLEDADLLVKTEPYKIKIPRGEKSGVVIEPMLTDQWYVKTEELAKPAIDAVRDGQIRFIPENWNKTYFNWMENIDDWCISRQLWWGHRIPAWYDSEGHIYVGYSEKDVRFKYKLDVSIDLKQDEDVLDTWFSSALWPFTSLGWPERSQDLEEFYPTSVLFTGFDIIFFWVARMIMMGLKFTGKIPFKEIYITGLICDADGKKMSKSKGNVLDPIDLIDGISLKELLEKRTSNLMLPSLRDKITKATRKQFPNGIPAFGTDALRFSYCSFASNTRQIKFDINRVEGYRNFCNKLWNAARFVLISTAENTVDFDDGAFQYTEADKWILSRLQKTIKKCHQYFADFRFDLLANTLYDFIWHEYCDWYLELSKTVIYDDNTIAPIRRGTSRTLIHVLSRALKLLHPIMPFITESIWQRLTALTSEGSETIVLSKYPEVEDDLVNPEIESEVEWLKKVIQTIRTIRSESTIAPSKAIPLVLKNSDKNIKERVEKYQTPLNALCKISSINFLKADEASPVSASAIIEDLEILIPLKGLVDVASELARLEKEIAKIDNDISFAEKKLNNPTFTSKAPKDIIAEVQEKLEFASNAKQKLLVNRDIMKSLEG